MTNRVAELVRELRRLNPESPVLRFFPEPQPSNVRVITHEDRERAAFRRLSLAVVALIQRSEHDE